MGNGEQAQAEALSTLATPRRRLGGRSARIRAAVLETTMNMLREQGSAEELHVAEVAARVGVPESTIYRHWKSREELLVETVMAHMEETIPLPDTGSFRADLQMFLRDSAVFLESSEGRLLTRSMFATMKHEDSKVRQIYWTARFSHAGVMIQRAVERGEIAPGINPDVVMTAVTGALYVRMLVLDAPLDELFLEQLAQMILKGVIIS
ncbi:TetR/AcrR family transcriptional regulator [Ktedonospora formicarum]|uniref:TetR family transcriptional regulator n=1 Tax=Ktedonospora formicarum TaxID=2778364 RepID=A0A8J3MYE5_9CHLR|nr:TetR/AcrR family transcriptional regulator [Ktedonospora formicarum]GHO50713.1 TetR family transcriptional regulator [Ktedonospora formicarum]